MSTVMWDQALQGVAPITGGQALPPGTYRLKAVAGEGKLNSNKAVMLSLSFEVASGPLQGRKAFHNENLPAGDTDKDKTRMGYFLGLMEAYGISGQNLGQWFAGRSIDTDTINYLAQQLVASGRIIKASCRPQQNDASRINWGGWMADDGIEPEPPKQTAAPSTPPGPPAPGMPGAGGGGFPQPGMQAGPPGLPLGGFPGSGQGAPNQAPQWAQQPVAAQAQPQGQQVFGGPGQAAPAAQPAAAGLNQFQQPAQGQFPGQQFQGQVNPATFPPQGQQAPAAQSGYDQQMQAQGGFLQQNPNGTVAPPQQPAPGYGQAPQQMPGMPNPQQPQNGLPQGGFPQQGQAPQANF